MNQYFAKFMALIVLLVTCSCAFDIARVHHQPVEIIQNDTVDCHLFMLDEGVKINLGTGYLRYLKRGTRWSYVGTVSQGDVFKTNDQVLTVEGSNIYEAYIVVAQKNLVGFFLPVEKAFSQLSQPVPLTIVVIN